MLPVAPSMATPFTAHPEPQEPEAHHRRGSQHAVDAIEHAAVSGKQPAAVLESRRRA